jgi:hypothetical protein
MKKIFIIENQDNKSVWSEGSRSIIGIEIDGLVLKIRKLKGIDVTLEGFLNILWKIHYDLDQINNNYERISPYKTYCYDGLSDSKTWKISYLQKNDSFWSEKRKNILHISCFRKVPNQNIFIPDLALIIPELVNMAGDNQEIKITETKVIEPEEEGYIWPTYELPFN